MQKVKSNTKKVEGIKAWAVADRPREKLALHGRRQLTNAELLAIMIRGGNQNETAVDLSKKILRFYEYDLSILSGLDVKDFTKFKGMAEAKATTIIAALELGRRRKELDKPVKPKISCPKDIYDYLRPDLADLSHEEFWILLLNRGHFVISKQCISKGGQSSTIVDPKIIFKIAIEQNAAAIILVHNHPSGNLKPSKADLSITKKLIEAGALLELPVLDHLIVTDQSFLSLADEGLIKREDKVFDYV